MTSRNPSGQGPRSNVFKACDACRQRKLKCNGLNPCERCINNSAHCNYRKKARRRDTATDKALTNQRADFIPIQPAVDHLAMGPAQPRATEIEDRMIQSELKSILRTIRITDSVPSRGTVTRSFGCTSSAAVLSLLLDLIWQSNSCALLPDKEYRNENTRDVLGYILRVFAISESSRPPLLNPALPGPLDTVPLEIQSIFLDQYISMAWKVLPFQSPNTLRAQLPHIADQSTSPIFDDCKARRSIFFPMLGIGAITAGYAELGSMFIADAQRDTLTADVVGDIIVLQSDLLMIQYDIDSGCFTSAYMRLGAMLPKILEAGMDNSARTPQEQAIISAFCCHESFVCFALGREAVFSRSLRYLPKSDKTIIGLMQPFFTILSEIQELHNPDGMNTEELWSASRSLEDRLRTFWLLENPHQGSTFKDDLDMGTVLLQHAILLLYRPFLILRAKREIRASDPQFKQSGTYDGSEITAIIQQACQYAIEAAIESLQFFRKLFETDSIQKILPNNSFFIESSCWVLIMDSLWGARTNLYMPLIKDSIRFMEQTAFLPGVSARLFTIRDILQRAGMGHIRSEELFDTGVLPVSFGAYMFPDDLGMLDQ